jgi:hypothetical protein
MIAIRKLCMLVGVFFVAACALAQKRPVPKIVEEVSFDWNHSGEPSHFTLYFENLNDGVAGDSDHLVVEFGQQKPWNYLNSDDEWGPFASSDLPKHLKTNLVNSKRLFFVSAGHAPNSRIYLILKGGGYGCCVGSLTVLTPGKDGTPMVVFHAVEHLLQDILPLPDGSGIELVGQPSDSEALATNAESYDPYRVYRIDGDKPARLDLRRSEAYTVKNYCEWAGPTYNEKFIAVSIDSHQFGLGHCRIMTRQKFDLYRQSRAANFR